jgi:hypothetical protein
MSTPPKPWSTNKTLLYLWLSEYTELPLPKLSKRINYVCQQFGCQSLIRVMEMKYWLSTANIKLDYKAKLEYEEYIQRLKSENTYNDRISNPDLKVLDDRKLDTLVDIQPNPKAPEFINLATRNVMQFSYHSVDTPLIREKYRKYLANFRQGVLVTNDNTEARTYQKQKEFMLRCIKEKSSNYGARIPFDSKELEEAGGRNNFTFLETLSCMADDNIIEIVDINVAYERRFEKDSPYILFAKICLLSRKSNANNQPEIFKETSISRLMLNPGNYDLAKGRLHIPGVANVDISASANAYRPPEPGTNKKRGEMYDQCRIMAALFKNVNTLNQGVKISQALGVSDTFMTLKHEKKIKNLVSQINLKVKDKTGIKKLVIITGNKVKINNSYL